MGFINLLRGKGYLTRASWLVITVKTEQVKKWTFNAFLSMTWNIRTRYGSLLAGRCFGHREWYCELLRLSLWAAGSDVNREYSETCVRICRHCVSPRDSVSSV